MSEIPNDQPGDTSMDEVLKTEADLKKDVDTWLLEITPARVAAVMAAKMAAFDATYSGVDAPDTLAKMRAEHEWNTRVKEDQRLRANGADIETRHADFMRSLTAVTTVLRKAPREKDPQVDSTRELAALQRFSNRRTADLVHAYRNTSDATNPTLINLIETDLAAFKLREELAADARARMELKQLIKQREDARVPADLLALESEGRTLLSGVNTKALLSHAIWPRLRRDRR
jgi:hypothetical protein